MSYDNDYQLAIELSAKEYNDIEEERFKNILKELSKESSVSRYNNRNYSNRNKKKKSKEEITIYDRKLLTPFCNYIDKNNQNIDRTYYLYKNNNSNKINILNKDEWYYSRNKMVCLFCDTKQGINEKCYKCHSKIANYYCSKCKFHSNSRFIKHCDKCKFCIYMYDNIEHCDECNKCVKKGHNCQNDDKMQNDCAICQNKICEESPHGNKTKNYITHSKCKNIFHTDCLKEYEKHGGKRCPLCRENLD